MGVTEMVFSVPAARATVPMTMKTASARAVILFFMYSLSFVRFVLSTLIDKKDTIIILALFVKVNHILRGIYGFFGF